MTVCKYVCPVMDWHPGLAMWNTGQWVCRPARHIMGNPRVSKIYCSAKLAWGTHCQAGFEFLDVAEPCALCYLEQASPSINLTWITGEKMDGWMNE